MDCPFIVLYNRLYKPINDVYTIAKILRKIIILTTSFFTILFLSISWFVFGIHVDREFTPRFAFWMEHDWSSIYKDFSALKEQVDELNITDLFFMLDL